MQKRTVSGFIMLVTALGLVACSEPPDPYDHPPCKQDDVTFPCKRG